MGKLVMIILTKSSKFSAKCVAGINVENGEWVRLVSDDVEKHGAIPDYKLQTDTREVCILDVVEVHCISGYTTLWIEGGNGRYDNET